MSAKDNGGSAFPWCGDLNDCPTIQLGMTLRDYFAAKAMQAMLSSPAAIACFLRNGKATSETIARDSYTVADAMLAERAK